jgi:hypothetical protein
MDKILEQRERALKSLRAADYLLSQNFSVFKDPKILVSALEDIFNCAASTMTAYLLFKRKNHEVEPFQDNFESKHRVFEANITDDLRQHLIFLNGLKKLIEFHKESPVEFRKKAEFVMCSDGYKDIEKLTPELLKGQISKAKLFIEDVFFLIDNPGVKQHG